MTTYHVTSIGMIKSTSEGFQIQIDHMYRAALQCLEDFSHINVIWWFHGLDNEEAKSILTVDQPYKNGPEKMGIFATRSPARPNSIALTTVKILHIDQVNGTILIPYIDAIDGSPVLDIKPYTPSIDRVEHPLVPDWCSNWPKSYETSGDFDWESVFQF